VWDSEGSVVNEAVESMSRQQDNEEQIKTEAFWPNHSIFQVPARVVAFRGRAESLVMLYLYDRANAVHIFCKDEVVIEIKVREETIAERTGLGRPAVSQAIRTLEASDCIRVKRTRDAITGRVRVSVYLLLHSQTKEPLKAFPQQFGVCHSNFEAKPYITLPKDARKIINEMLPAGRAVYITAMLLASRSVRMTLGIARCFFQDESLLGKNAFNRGLRECEKRGLFSYRRQILVLNDPRTGKPSERSKYAGRTEHTDPAWQFDLDTVKPEHWQSILEKILHTELIVGSDGWTKTNLQSLCPFCKEARCFAVNFAASQFKCHAPACGEKGRLAQLVRRVLRINNMAQTKVYLQQCIAALQEVTI
jgi:hypothetical protein